MGFGADGYGGGGFGATTTDADRTATTDTSDMVTWETAADWDAAQDETGVHHEQPTGTNWAASDTIEKGYPADWSNTSLPTPVSYYPLDETSGSTANDVVGGNDGTINGADLGQPGVMGGNSMYFDGGDSIDISQSGLTDSGVTLAAWVNFASGFGDDQVIVYWGASNQVELWCGLGADMTITYWDGSTIRGEAKIPSGTMSTGTWYHVLGTFDGTETWEIYLDGSKQDTVTDDPTIDMGGSTSTLGDHPSVNRQFDGYMAHPMLIDSYYTSSQADALYKAAV